MGLTEVITILNLAQTLMGIESQMLSKMDGTEEIEHIIKVDLRIYGLICRAIEILSAYEEEQRQ